VNKFSTRFMTRTAILLALTVAVQMAGRSIPAPANSYIVGPLVNACILISTAFVGLTGGIIISILAPFTSLINNHAVIAPILLLFAPFIAIGNMLLAFCFHILKKKSQVAGIIIGAILKFGFLFGAIKLFVNLKGDIKPKIVSNLVSLFSFPQLITALIGGIIAIAVIKALKNNLEII
jgi:hypothetical protein